MDTNILSQDIFIHLTDIQDLMAEMQKGADWSKSEMVKLIFEEILKLNRFVITVERK